MRSKKFNWMILACVVLISTVAVAQQDKKPLTNQDVIKMVKAGLPEDTIVLAIQKSPNQFDTSPDALITLKEAGATQKVLDAILQAQSPPTNGAIGSVEELRKLFKEDTEKESELNLRGLKLGTYKAVATETITSTGSHTLRDHQMIRIKIENIDEEGNVRAELIRAGNKGRLKGKIDAKGNLRLEGYIITRFEWKFTLTATVGDKSLTNGKYYNVSQSVETTGEFNVAELEEDN